MADEETGGGQPGPVPYVKFQKLTEERRLLREELRGRDAQLSELQKRISELEPSAKLAEERAAALDKVKLEYKTAADGWAEERGLMAHGVTDPADQAVARTLFGLLPDENRPKNVGEWLATFKAEKDAPAPPKQLAHLFGQPQAQGKQTPRLPNAGGTGDPPLNGGKPTVASLTAAREQFVRGEIDAPTFAALSGLPGFAPTK